MSDIDKNSKKTIVSKIKEKLLIRDIKNKNLILFKIGLMLLLAILTGSLLLLRHPELIDIALIIITVWAACRFYFGAFYVIEHWIDPEYKFDGLLHFVYWFSKKYLKRSNP